jgi:DNA-binding transcriptional MerR regulator
MAPIDENVVTGEGVYQPAPIPDKLFFKIGEVSQLVGVEAYVLRYWESEFKGLSPKKSSSGQRMFRRKDVELLLQIKHLLYDKKFTIEGARKALAEKPKEAPKPAKKVKQASLFGDASDPLPEIRREIASILKLLA